jgi:hypothetical protein
MMITCRLSRVLLFITITALVLPSIVQAGEVEEAALKNSIRYLEGKIMKLNAKLTQQTRWREMGIKKCEGTKRTAINRCEAARINDVQQMHQQFAGEVANMVNENCTIVIQRDVLSQFSTPTIQGAELWPKLKRICRYLKHHIINYAQYKHHCRGVPIKEESNIA